MIVKIPFSIWCILWIFIALAMIDAHKRGWNAGVKACLDAGSLCSKMYEGAK